MSGHSKFANIKRKKEANDSKRGKIFTKLGRELAVAVKSGGPDPKTNNRLRDVIAKAKSENMPNETIERNVKKASGDLGSVNYEYIIYEGYGPNGVAVIVEALTDNRNRAAANVRNAFTKGGGNLGATGCVSFLFEEKGLIMVEADDAIDEDELMVCALEAGASDFKSIEGGYEIFTEQKDFSTTRDTLEQLKIPMISAEITKIPQTEATLENSDDIKKMNKLLDLLNDDDDVQNVWHNWQDADE
ncbi:MAG: YebC/PmpR family DNA-binding transcriptional regulator [Clostridiales bacterium]|jgi:YebC/PmpR family DNA-binding regulatory protein|nr:YebC/PmpR family DNA-binding transcriptional regulator [Clostridiales bacterium]